MIPHLPTPRVIRYRFRTASALAFAVAFTTVIHAAAPMRIAGPGQITLSGIEVAAYPQTVHSGDAILTLTNKNDNAGWVLTAEVLNGGLMGDATGALLGATVSFKSITWLSGGNGSAAGIAIASDGSRIEADPGFGKGEYSIVFAIQYEVPAFPRADTYRGVTSFSLL